MWVIKSFKFFCLRYEQIGRFGQIFKSSGSIMCSVQSCLMCLNSSMLVGCSCPLISNLWLSTFKGKVLTFSRSILFLSSAFVICWSIILAGYPLARKILFKVIKASSNL